MKTDEELRAGRKLGQIGLRIPEDTHLEILRITDTLGLDLTTVVNLCLAESLPSLTIRVVETMRRREEARRMVAEMSSPK